MTSRLQKELCNCSNLLKRRIAMEQSKLEALAKEIAKDIKTQEDL